jgi:hypothetical protein
VRSILLNAVMHDFIDRGRAGTLREGWTKEAA